MKAVTITEVHFAAAGPDDVSTGLLGWVSATLNGSLRLDGLALRRTAVGDLTISFPARRDSAGQQHPYVRPLNDASRRDVEDQILVALGLRESPTA